MRRKLKDLKNLDNHFEKANFFCQLLVLDKYMISGCMYIYVLDGRGCL